MQAHFIVFKIYGGGSEHDAFSLFSLCDFNFAHFSRAFLENGNTYGFSLQWVYPTS